jgi:hypothetical protein
MSGRKRVTIGDKILIAALATVSLLSFFFLSRSAGASTSRYVSIQVNGKETERIPLDSSAVGRKLPIRTVYGYNLIEVGENRVRIVEADCLDRLCVHQGWIDRPGQLIVCLPNRLVVEVVDDEREYGDDLDGVNY